MRQFLILLGGVAFLTAVPISCTEEPNLTTEVVPNVEADVQAQRDLAEEFDAAVHSGDLERFLGLYAEGAVHLPPGTRATESQPGES